MYKKIYYNMIFFFFSTFFCLNIKFNNYGNYQWIFISIVFAHKKLYK